MSLKIRRRENWKCGRWPSYIGKQAGSCEYYPDLNGDRRADQHTLLGTFYADARTWYNTCD
jgi:hypothetical protein